MLPFKPLKYTENAGLIVLGCIFFLLPCVYSSLFIEPTQTTKFLFFGYTVVIAFSLIACYRLYAGSRSGFQVSVVDVSLLLLLIYIVTNRYYIQPVAGFSMRFLELTGLVIGYLTLKALPRKYYLYILLSISAGGFLQVLTGLMQLLGLQDSRNSYFPVTGNFFNPGGYAGYISLTAVVSFGIYINRNRLLEAVSEDVQNKKKSLVTWVITYLPMLSFIGSIIILPGLRSRSAYVSVVAGVGLIWLLYKSEQVDIKAKWPVKRIAVAGILLLGVFYSIYQFKKHSADGRLLIYKISLVLIQEHPFFGVGFDRFRASYMDEQAKWFEHKSGDIAEEAQLADNTFYAFNEPLQFTVENGLIGLALALVAVFFCCWFREKAKEEPLRNIVYGILLSCFVFSLFTYASDNLAIKCLLVFALAVLSQVDSRKLTTIHIARTRVLAPVFTLCILFFVCWGVNAIEGMRKSFLAWGNGQVYYVRELYTESNNSFESVYPVFHENGEFLMQYGKSLAMTENYSKALSILKEARKYLSSGVVETAIGDCERKSGNYKDAESAYLHAMYMIPNRFYPLYLLMTLYNDNGEPAKAVKMARSIKIKKVKVPSKAVNEIKRYAENLIKEKHPASSDLTTADN
ncbi:O-antigen ligase domain-containing protein [Chitinophaga sp. 180180018-2]|nr:O-antigen ligase domain-containing protein [Chitinophaga sp. 212800010-3]